MNSKLMPFDFQNQEIRVVIDKQEQPWFVAKDICETLEFDITKVKQVLDTHLEEDEKGRYTIPTLGGSQEVWCINESGLYCLILRSNKPKAKVLRKWVTSEVLPSIRKTGKYNSDNKFQISNLNQAFDTTKLAKDTRAWKQICSALNLKGNQLTLSIINGVKHQYNGLNILGILDIPEQFVADNQTSHHYTSTQLGVIITERLNLPESLKANKVNQLLESQGFAYPIKNSKGNIEKWEVTDKGKPHGLFLDSGKRHQTTSQPITTWHWYLSILDILDLSQVDNLVSAKTQLPKSKDRKLSLKAGKEKEIEKLLLESNLFSIQ